MNDEAVFRLDERDSTAKIHDRDRIRQTEFRCTCVGLLTQVQARLDALGVEFRRQALPGTKLNAVFSYCKYLSDEPPGFSLIE